MADPVTPFEPFEPTTGAGRLNVGQSCTATVPARQPWVSTGLYVEKGERYTLSAAGTWTDKDYKTDPDGYASPKALMRAFEWARRVRKAKWFALIGCIDRKTDTTFVIGKGPGSLEAPVSGVLLCYANDVRGFYGNNSGAVALTIERIA